MYHILEGIFLETPEHKLGYLEKERFLSLMRIKPYKTGRKL
jgi:hypothetical protein